MKRLIDCSGLVLCVVAIAGCSAPQYVAASSVASPSGVQQHSQAAWVEYQASPDNNAVFNRPGFAPRWRYDAKEKINSGLALVGNTIVFDTFGKRVVALDALTGTLRWQAHLNNIVMSTPVVADGLVFVGTGRNGILDMDSNPILHLRFSGKEVWGVPAGDDVAALDLSDGKTRWTFHTVGEDMPSPVYYNGTIIFANGDWHAYALRADTGREVWSTDIGGASTMASATIGGGNVIVAGCANGIRKSSALALNPNTGKIVWQSPYGHCDNSPTFADGKVFVESVEATPIKYVGRTVIAALDAKTGKPAWVYRSPRTGTWTILSSDESTIAGVYHNGIYYQPAPLDNELLAFDARTGKVRWRFRTSGPVKMSPVVKDGKLYVGDTVGVLYTLDSNTGSIIEIRPFKKPFTTSPPVIAGNTMFIVNGTTVYAMPLSGEIKESSEAS